MELRSKSRLDQNKIILPKEQSALISVIDVFEEDNMQTQYSVLDYRTDL